MSRVHHVFVRDRASGVWAHETAFADRRDAEAERDDYRDKPTTRAVRIIAGPGAGEAHFAWIARQGAVLNGPVTTTTANADVEAMRAADDRLRREAE